MCVCMSVSVCGGWVGRCTDNIQQRGKDSQSLQQGKKLSMSQGNSLGHACYLFLASTINLKAREVIFQDLITSGMVPGITIKNNYRQ